MCRGLYATKNSFFRQRVAPAGWLGTTRRFGLACNLRVLCLRAEQPIFAARHTNTWDVPPARRPVAPAPPSQGRVASELIYHE